MKPWITVCLPFIFTCSLYAQEPVPSKKQVKASHRREVVKKLKEGGLLVRLKTKNNTITSLRSSGKSKLADETEAAQSAYNREIISAFRKYYRTGPVYFFFSDYSEQLKSKNLEAVVFLNDSLLPDPSIRVSSAGFLTAEFGVLEEMGIQALIIMDDNFVQMKKPFPYYVRTYDDLPLERNLPRVITILQEKLDRYAGN